MPRAALGQVQLVEVEVGVQVEVELGELVAVQLEKLEQPVVLQLVLVPGPAPRVRK
jgi:hypothetical protein